jgi:ATP-binding cassette subfamily C protein
MTAPPLPLVPAAPAAAVLPVAGAATTRRALWALLRARPVAHLLPLLVLLLAAAASAAAPPLLGALVDVAEGTRTTPLPLLLGGLLAAVVAAGLLSGIGGALVVRAGERMLAGVREDVVARALDVPQTDLEQAGTGDLVARVTGDVEAVQAALRRALPSFALSGLEIALTGVGLLLLDPRLAAAALLAVPVQLSGLRWYLRRSGPQYAEDRAAQGSLTQALGLAVEGAATARALRRTGEQRERVGRSSRTAVDTSVRVFRTQVLFFARLNAAELVGLSAVVAVGFLGVRGGWLSLGEATAAALYVLRLFDPVTSLLSLVDTLQSATAALARLVGVTALPSPPTPAGSRPRTADLQLRDVVAGYPGRPPALSGVDLTVRAGQRVAVVGASGAGKTTLARVATGLLRPAAGSVLLGGVPASALAPGVVVLVPQDAHVFAGPLSEDLRLAAPGGDDATLLQALDRVGAGWVRDLPGGLDTVVGAGGHALSAAQAQAVALARVLLADPQVVVLDEATAAGGGTGARVLEDAVEAVLVGRTAVVVAHRLDQAARADRVVVLEQGRVVEEGSHAELLRAGGPYAALWQVWAATV